MLYLRLLLMEIGEREREGHRCFETLFLNCAFYLLFPDYQYLFSLMEMDHYKM